MSLDWPSGQRRESWTAMEKAYLRCDQSGTREKGGYCGESLFFSACRGIAEQSTPEKRSGSYRENRTAHGVRRSAQAEKPRD
jgi:hypothetical protein